jgi:hypothetical protein
VDDLEVTVYWCGSKLGHVAPWSHTRGELCAPIRQRRRPDGADPLDTDDDLDAFGLLRESPPARVSVPSSPA